MDELASSPLQHSCKDSGRGRKRTAAGWLAEWLREKADGNTLGKQTQGAKLSTVLLAAILRGHGADTSELTRYGGQAVVAPAVCKAARRSRIAPNPGSRAPRPWAALTCSPCRRGSSGECSPGPQRD